MRGALAVLKARNAKTLMHLREEQHSRSPPTPQKRLIFYASVEMVTPEIQALNTKAILHMTDSRYLDITVCTLASGRSTWSGRSSKRVLPYMSVQRLVEFLLHSLRYEWIRQDIA
jgi:hypothetical protein